MFEEEGMAVLSVMPVAVIELMSIPKFLLFIILIILVPKLVFAQKVFSFEGRIDLLKNEFNIVLDLDEKSSIAATARKISETNYQFSVDVKHLKTPLFDLLSKIESSIEIISTDSSSEKIFPGIALKGKVWSRYSLVDYKPIKELSGGFEIKNQRLYLTELSFGNLNCNGFIDLVQPYKLNLSLDLVNVSMSNFLNFWNTNKQYESSGTISGKIRASGTLDNLMLKGSLESRNGSVQKLDYNAISLNIEGIYPDLEITNSTISKSDGVSFTLNGPFDLSDRGHFKKQIKALTIAPLVSHSGSEGEWTIKRLNLEKSGITEIKYRLRKRDVLGAGILASDETDMLGFERTRKF